MLTKLATQHGTHVSVIMYNNHYLAYIYLMYVIHNNHYLAYIYLMYVIIHNNHYLAYIYLMYQPHLYFFFYKYQWQNKGGARE